MAKSAKSLIIVESPTKTKTIGKFLGSDFVIESSVGHIRDLPSSGYGVRLSKEKGDKDKGEEDSIYDENFQILYLNSPDKSHVIKKLQQEASKADMVYLAPDPDREGEAIAWHLAQLLPKNKPFKRVTFNAITKSAVLEALKNPRDINQELVDAQQARRLLDRIVGYKISPILSRRVGGSNKTEGKLSAGRVQSVALKLVVDREKEIEAFNPVEYWTIASLLEKGKGKKSPQFNATVHSIDGKRVEKEAAEDDPKLTTIGNETRANEIVARIKKAAFTVGKVDKKERNGQVLPPFITSTLQQEASRRFGFSAQRTMGIAQSLYEGVDLGSKGTEGLITYMRTDSVRIEPGALFAAREYIEKEKRFGKDLLPETPRQFQTSKKAQDAHEAIRPTTPSLSPESIKAYLTADQYKIYSIIWMRFIASQMKPPLYDTVTCDVETDNGIMLRVTGSVIKFKGSLLVYEEQTSYDKVKENEEDAVLPDLAVGETLSLVSVSSTQSFTKPPPRYTEASLIKELESSGIGRPSTYATIMSKIQSRDYTVKEKNALIPTLLGKVASQLIEEYYPFIMNVEFTRNMEEKLEGIEEGNDWRTLIRGFWEEFEGFHKTAEKDAHVPKVLTDLDCPKCGSKLNKIWGRGNYFYGCSGHPECDYTTSMEKEEFDQAAYNPKFDWDQVCPKCGGPMKIRFARGNRDNPFLGCAGYPECSGIVNVPKHGDPSIESMPPCPAIDCPGRMTMRRNFYGQNYFSCSTYPDCDVIVNKIEKLGDKYPPGTHVRTAYVKKTKKGAKKDDKKESKTVKGKKATATKATGKTPAAKTVAKKPVKKAAKKSSAPDYPLSKELQAVVKVERASRPEVTKLIWEYIREKNLQDATNRQNINPDATLGKVLGKTQVSMFQIAKLIGPHILKSTD